MKKCNKCGEIKSKEHFTVLKRNIDGLHTICKLCSLQDRRYQVSKYDQYIALKKRASLTKESLVFTMAEFYIFIEEHKPEFCDIALQKLTPYVDRIDSSLPFSLENLEILSRPRAIKPLTATHASTGTVRQFRSFKDARKSCYYRNYIVAAISSKKPYKEYTWEYTNVILY